MVHDIEKTVADYLISNNYTSAAEIGYGGKTYAAEILINAGISVICTDVHTYDTTVKSVVDDCFDPDLSIYECADVIYSIRPGIEMIPAIIEIAKKTNSDLIVYHLGFEYYGSGGEKIEYKGITLHKYN
ncbi:MAG TPA: UPF0146 family protein [Methanocorpusculum sp.]|nr:UPF0146 family protein [Methanocorpusculum sp.]